jgi:hypothetical protein
MNTTIRDDLHTPLFGRGTVRARCRNLIVLIGILCVVPFGLSRALYSIAVCADLGLPVPIFLLDALRLVLLSIPLITQVRHFLYYVILRLGL